MLCSLVLLSTALAAAPEAPVAEEQVAPLVSPTLVGVQGRW